MEPVFVGPVSRVHDGDSSIRPFGHFSENRNKFAPSLAIRDTKLHSINWFLSLLHDTQTTPGHVDSVLDPESEDSSVVICDQIHEKSKIILSCMYDAVN